MFKSIRFILVVSLFAGSASVSAQDAPIIMTTVAEKEEAYTDDQGVERTRLVPAATVIPGDRIIYTITFANTGNDVVNDIGVVDPIPAHMRYVDGSAFGPGTSITYSADDGQTFGAPDEVTLLDDTGQSRIALATEYTHIRWAFKNPLEPGTQAYARFKAELK